MKKILIPLVLLFLTPGCVSNPDYFKADIGLPSITILGVPTPTVGISIKIGKYKKHETINRHGITLNK